MENKIGAVNKSLGHFCRVHTTPETTYGQLPEECNQAASDMLACGREKLLEAYGPQCASDTLATNDGHGVQQVTSVTDWYNKNKVRINTKTVVYMNILGGPRGTRALIEGNVTGLCDSASSDMHFPTLSFYDSSYRKVLGSGAAMMNTVIPTTLGYALAFIVFVAAGFSFYRANRSRRLDGGAGALGLIEAAPLQQVPATDEAAEA
jgi:hypothetical protein